MTLEAVMRELGKSQATIERMVRAGTLESQLFPREGKRPVRLYRLEGMKSVQRPASLIRMRPLKQTDELILNGRTTMTSLENVMMKLLDRKDKISVREKLWLSLEESAEYSGLARGDLLRLCREGEKLTVRKSGGWRIQRASLEAYNG